MKRETRITVTFTHPFQLKGIDRTLPPGDYTILTEEELTNGILEQYSLSAISALAERAVAALVPEWVPDRGPF